jgi:hypothetical protein
VYSLFLIGEEGGRRQYFGWYYSFKYHTDKMADSIEALSKCYFISLVIIITDLRNWTTGVRSPAEAKGFFSPAFVSRPAISPTQPPVQWEPGSFPGVKRGWGVTLTTHSIYCRGQEKVGPILPLPFSPAWR